MPDTIHLSDLATSAPTNMTLRCGLVRHLEEPSSAALQGHSDSTIFVFERRGGRLLHTLQGDQTIGLGQSLSNWVRGVEYAAYAVSTRLKRVRFTADFQCANVALQRVAFSLDVAAADAREVAADVLQGEDPIFSLCEKFRAHLVRRFNTVRLQDIHNMPQFNQEIFSFFDSIQAGTSIIRVADKEILIPTPNIVTQTQAGQLAFQSEQLKQRARLELQTMEMDWAGIHDPQMKLMLSNLSDRSQTLQKLLDHRLEHFSNQTDRANRILQKKLETVGGFLRSQLTDQSSMEDVQQMLQLLDGAESQQSSDFRFKILDGSESQRPALPRPQDEVTAAQRPHERAHFRIITHPPDPAETNTTTPAESAPPISVTAEEEEGASSAEPSSRQPRFQAKKQDIGDEEIL